MFFNDSNSMLERLLELFSVVMAASFTGERFSKGDRFGVNELFNAKGMLNKSRFSTGLWI